MSESTYLFTRAQLAEVLACTIGMYVETMERLSAPDVQTAEAAALRETFEGLDAEQWLARQFPCTFRATLQTLPPDTAQLTALTDAVSEILEEGRILGVKYVVDVEDAAALHAAFAALYPAPAKEGSDAG